MNYLLNSKQLNNNGGYTVSLLCVSNVEKSNLEAYMEDTGAVGSVSDFGLRGPQVNPPQGWRLLWPRASHISTAQYVNI